MNEVFGKNPITSSDFPVILFDATGTIVHTNPSFELYSNAKVWEAGVRKTEAELQSAITAAISKINDIAEKDLEYQFHPKKWLQLYLEELGLSSEVKEKLEKGILEGFSLTAKMVIPQSTLDLCEILQERGYRLAIVTNSESAFTDILRAQGVLQYFESVITSQDVGYKKPHPKIFEAALEDLDIQSSQAVMVGDSYSNDILGAKRAYLNSVLYDPQLRELKALHEEDTSGKVVSIDTLRHNRRLQNVKVITKIEQLLEFFK